jgi:hypothetical protein
MLDSVCYHTGMESDEQLMLWKDFSMPYDAVPFWYLLTDGITISEYPADRWGDDPRRLEAALARGITVFLDLTEPGETSRGRPLQPYADLLHRLAAQRGLSVDVHRMPVPDLTAPRVMQMRRILDTIDDARADGHGVLIHCLGGIGRSGAVAGCYLVRHGWTPDQALLHIQTRVNASSKRGRPSPEMAEQVALVRDWPTLDWPTLEPEPKREESEMDTAERIARTQAWLRRHAPPRELPLLLTEVGEMAHWTDAELAQWRYLLIDDYADAIQMRSSLFPNLVSFEAWHRLTGYVLGQPMDAATARRTDWLWNYSRDLYEPYNAWMVEEQAMIVIASASGLWEVLLQDWQAQCDRLRALDPNWTAIPTPDKAAFWQKLGTSPLFMKLFNEERW